MLSLAEVYTTRTVLHFTLLNVLQIQCRYHLLVLQQGHSSFRFLCEILLLNSEEESTVQGVARAHERLSVSFPAPSGVQAIGVSGEVRHIACPTHQALKVKMKTPERLSAPRQAERENICLNF